MKLLRIFLLTFSIGNLALAQDTLIIMPEPYSVQDFPESGATSDRMEVLNIASDTTQVTYVNDVKYITRDGVDLALQIIVPKHGKGLLPCIVYVQGSAWMKQNVYANLPQLAQFAKRGYVIAMVEYRPSSVAPFPAQVQDAKTAIRFMRRNAEKYRIDTNNLFIWGDSSGGHTSLMVGLTQNNPELDTEAYEEFSTKVNAVVDFYGPTDIAQMNYEPSVMDHIGAESPEGKLIGGKNVLENKELAARTNPINYINDSATAAPILIIHGSKDRLVPFKQSVLLANALERKNYRYEFYQLKGANHGTSEFWTTDIFEIVDAFLKANLR